MNAIQAPGTAVGFIVLTVVMYMLVFRELKLGLEKTTWDSARKSKFYNRFRLVVLGWAIFISALSLSGFLSDFSPFPPRIMIVLFIPLMTSIVATFSGAAKEILPHIPAKNIVRLQVFRVFVEILLWMLFLQNALPVQMTFEGRNFDVISGLTAPLAAFFIVRNRIALALWNILGFALLVNIVTIALLSFPTPLRVFMNEPSNTIVTHFPYVWLPGLLVPLAYGLHFFSLRQISLASKAQAVQAA